MENQLKYHKVLINMYEWIDIIDAQRTFVPKSIFEIGSLNGNDAAILENRYKTNNVTIFEAHPVFFEKIKASYPNFKVFNYAGSNTDGEISFNGVSDTERRIGTSSVLDRNGIDYNKYTVMAKRPETFINDNNIESIDLLKIDVEGLSYELLSGFGKKLNIIKSIHIENEHVPVWKNQKLYTDVEKLLLENNFVLVSIKAAFPQTDSVWFRRDVFNKDWWK